MNIQNWTCGQSLDHSIATPPELIEGRSLIFNDQFVNGVDPALWRTELLWTDEVTINKENQLYVDTQNGNDPPFDNLPSPFSTGSDGALNITASPLPPELQNIERNLTLSSGKICAPMHAFRYGYIEWCVRVPCAGLGSWPAVWLLNRFYYDNADQKIAAEPGGTGHDKFNPEIDFEWVYGDGVNGPSSGSNAIKHALHYFTGDRNDASNYRLWTIDSGGFRETDANTGSIITNGNLTTGCNGQPIGLLPDTAGDYCQNYHTFGINWQPDRLEWIVDGVVRQCITDPQLIPDQLMYPIVNYAVGGTFPFGNPPSQQPPLSQFPQTMEIQSVRIWQ